MTTIAVIYGGDSADPRAWSGVPHGLTSGLMACGIDICRVDAAVTRPIDLRLKRIRLVQPEYARMKSRVARRRLVAAGEVDAALQIGSDFRLDTEVPTATYDDMTVAQHEQYGGEWFLRHPRRVRKAWLQRQRAVYANATVCTVMSSWVADSLVNDYGLSRAKVAVVGVGVNYPFVASLDRDWSDPRFLVVAQDWRRKNVPQVVSAFADVRGDWPTAKLDVVGPYPGPPSEGVTLHGRLRPDSDQDRRTMLALYASATCFVMPSKFEPFGIAYADAGSAGVPSIGTSVGGAAELIGDGGTVVDPDDPGALRDAMRAMCDPHTARGCGAVAAQRSAEFRWDRVARRIVDALGLAATPV